MSDLKSGVLGHFALAGAPKRGYCGLKWSAVVENGAFWKPFQANDRAGFQAAKAKCRSHGEHTLKSIRDFGQ
jgi:hypothetical protein